VLRVDTAGRIGTGRGDYEADLSPTA
jgi:hypothetical protein